MRHLPLVMLLAAACGAESAAPSSSDPPAAGDAERAIREADIVQVVDGTLFAMSKAGSVSVVDVAEPGKLVLLGQAQLPGEPFEMYFFGHFLIAMTNATTDKQSHVVALDITHPEHIKTASDVKVAGLIADSRLGGTVLYLVTYENAACLGCGPKPRTLVTTLDLAQPYRPARVDQLAFESNAPDSYNLPWGSHWTRSILATPTRMYVGGHADIAPNGYSDTTDEGIIDVVDISDPAGHLVQGPRIMVAGAILSRWQLDERDDVLRVISQRGAGRSRNGLAAPEIATYALPDFKRIGHATMTLPQPEGLRTVRFDGERAYAITYNQTDPMFVIDLRAPARPAQRGALYMAGFMYYLEPHGNRVIGLGIDRTDPQGSLNVSLFDVTDADNPRMIERVGFAQPYIGEDFAILNGEVAEDQDRIQKAFHVYDDGLVVVPFSALRSYSEAADCTTNAGGGIQLVTWANDTLTRSQLLPLPGNPRRALELGNELLAVSDSTVRTFARDDLRPTADLTIDACVPRDPWGGAGANQGGAEGYRDAACSAGGSPGVLLGVVLVALRRRRVTSRG